MLMQISNRQYQYFEIDDEDFDIVSKYTWGIKSGGYIRSSIKGKHVLLHRMLLGLVTGDGKIIDHKDGDRTNNRRNNLRICTPSQNSRNSSKRSNNLSGFKGVSKDGNGWRAQIWSDEKLYLGTYDNKIEAAKAYDKAAYKQHNEFARLNFDIDSENHFSKDLTSSFNFYKPSYSSKYYGVSYAKSSGRWSASMYKYGHIGCFKTEKEAALAIDEYLIKNNLDKSKLNFPQKIEK